MIETATSTGSGGKRNGAGRKPRSDSVNVDVRERLVIAKADREEYLSRLAELEVAEREGRLIDAARAAEQARRASSVARDAILSVPARICHDLAALGSDADAMERLMADALRAELLRIAHGNAEG